MFKTIKDVVGCDIWQQSLLAGKKMQSTQSLDIIDTWPGCLQLNLLELVNASCKKVLVLYVWPTFTFSVFFVIIFHSRANHRAYQAHSDAAVLVFGPRLKGCHIFDEEPQGFGRATHDQLRCHWKMGSGMYWNNILLSMSYGTEMEPNGMAYYIYHIYI